MSCDFGAIQGRKDGSSDGMSGYTRNPRPDYKLSVGTPGYVTSYQAAYDIAYNRGFAEREHILREAALREQRMHQNDIAREDAERQADRDRDV